MHLKRRRQAFKLTRLEPTPPKEFVRQAIAAHPYLLCKPSDGKTARPDNLSYLHGSTFGSTF